MRVEDLSHAAMLAGMPRVTTDDHAHAFQAILRWKAKHSGSSANDGTSSVSTSGGPSEGEPGPGSSYRPGPWSYDAVSLLTHIWFQEMTPADLRKLLQLEAVTEDLRVMQRLANALMMQLAIATKLYDVCLACELNDNHEYETPVFSISKFDLQPHKW